MGTHIVILGGGTAGTMTANRLLRTYDERECRITVATRTTITATSPAD